MGTHWWPAAGGQAGRQAGRQAGSGAHQARRLQALQPISPQGHACDALGLRAKQQSGAAEVLSSVQAVSGHGERSGAVGVLLACLGAQHVRVQPYRAWTGPMRRSPNCCW